MAPVAPLPMLPPVGLCSTLKLELFIFVQKLLDHRSNPRVSSPRDIIFIFDLDFATSHSGGGGIMGDIRSISAMVGRSGQPK